MFHSIRLCFKLFEAIGGLPLSLSEVQSLNFKSEDILQIEGFNED